MVDAQSESQLQRKDPRPAQTRELVLHAARMIVAAEGQSAVTPTRLVEMSGVARSTIYRHWSDAAAIVTDAMSVEGEDLRLHSTGDLAADLRAYLGQLRDTLESPAATIIVTQAEIAERDEGAAEMLSGNGKHRKELIRQLADDPRPDFEIPHAQLVGPLFMQRYFVRRPITDELIDAVIDSYLAARPDSSP